MPSLLLYLISLAAVLAIAPPVTVYWDAFGYILQSINGDVGGLGFGRPVFAFGAHALTRGWLEAGGSPWHVEALLRVACALVSSAAAPLTARLAVECGAGQRPAWIAGLAVACSPAMAHTNGQVLTDGPAVTLLLVACVLGVRAIATPRSTGRALASGVVLGLAIGVREQMALNVLTLGLLAMRAPPERRRSVAFAIAVGCGVAVAVPLFVAALTQPGYVGTVKGWLAGVRLDRAAKTYSWRDAGVYVFWLACLGPATLAAGCAAVVLALRSSRWPGPSIVAIVVPACLQLIWMATFRGIDYSPRLLLSALPAMAIAGAMAVAPWATRSRAHFSATIAACVLPLMLAAPIVRTRSRPLVAILREWPHRLSTLPSSSVIVTGQPCPAVPLIRALVARDRAQLQPVPDWQAICPGWGWPEDLAETLDGARHRGQTVAADLRSSSWTGVEQLAARDELEQYVHARTRARDDAQLVVWTN